jgi:nitrate/TMAO reductase-like tetraheme cytochrome c subunit
MQMPTLSGRGYLSPLIYLSNNWVSLAGVVIVTTATVFWLFLLPTTLRGEVAHPYIGILVFLILPAGFLIGLALIPLGMLRLRRREGGASFHARQFPPVNWSNPYFRRLVWFFGLTTFANLVIASQLAYSAVNYMDSVTFYSLTCHTIMQPEYTGHQNSPHARVACVSCHIGPGATWFVRTKLSGASQVFATILDTYPRPIPSPVRDLRPVRETCEVCHWPQRFDPDRLRIIPNFADDEHNTFSQTVMMVKIGGGNGGAGIHGMHLGEGIRIRYASDETRQTIPWVEYQDAKGHRTVYAISRDKPETLAKMAIREMDCIDCHNRPTHTFQLPERALDAALASGAIPASLPFVKKQGLAIVKQSYASRAEAAIRIPAAIDTYYRDQYRDVYRNHRSDVSRVGQALLDLYDRNVFPAMKVGWGTYPENLGHTDFPGCFRCHDGSHVGPGGAAITQDCGVCHNLLAMQETNPKILTELGISTAPEK